MALVKFRPASELQREIDSMINTFWGSPGSRNGSSSWQPRVDIVEGDEGFSLYAELPGMTREDIQITVEDKALVIEGERKPTHTPSDRGMNHHELYYGRFKRTFSLPDNVKADRMTATYRDGILHLNVPKAEEAKPRTIEVTVE